MHKIACCIRDDALPSTARAVSALHKKKAKVHSLQPHLASHLSNNQSAHDVPFPMSGKRFKTMRDTEFYENGSIQQIQTSAKIIYLINYTVFEAVLFVDKEGNPSQGTVMMGENATIGDLEGTKKNADVIKYK